MDDTTRGLLVIAIAGLIIWFIVSRPRKCESCDSYHLPTFKEMWREIKEWFIGK